MDRPRMASCAVDERLVFGPARTVESGVVRKLGLVITRAGATSTADFEAELARFGQELVRRNVAAYAVIAYLADYFRSTIYPALTPLAFDPGHPFPFISNLSKNLAVVVRHDGQTKFARVKIPDRLPRFVRGTADVRQQHHVRQRQQL